MSTPIIDRLINIFGEGPILKRLKEFVLKIKERLKLTK
jgi:hypothetical protein